jgi:hypothetical protein
MAAGMHMKPNPTGRKRRPRHRPRLGHGCSVAAVSLEGFLSPRGSSAVGSMPWRSVMPWYSRLAVRRMPGCDQLIYFFECWPVSWLGRQERLSGPIFMRRSRFAEARDRQKSLNQQTMGAPRAKRISEVPLAAHQAALDRADSFGCWVAHRSSDESALSANIRCAVHSPAYSSDVRPRGAKSGTFTSTPLSRLRSAAGDKGNGRLGTCRAPANPGRQVSHTP